MKANTKNKVHSQKKITTLDQWTLINFNKILKKLKNEKIC